MVGLSERTVYRWLGQATAPSRRHHTRSSSVIDPYQAYLRKRWQEGCRKGSVLCRELKAHGYHGSERAVYRYLPFLKEQAVSEEVPKARLPLFSRKKTTWLLVKEACKLTEEEQEMLTALRQASPTANRIYPLVQDFGHMLRQRQGERLDAWLTSVEASAIAELQTFAAGIQRDKAAVQAGLTLSYSNGLLEGAPLRR